MPTITLGANRINQMPVLLTNTSSAVKGYKSNLEEFRLNLLTIDSSVCNLEDVISSVKASTEIQEVKRESLDRLNQDVSNFVTDVVQIDEDVADIINRSRDDFYDKYYYLKPQSEKSWWEKFKDSCKKVVEWCEEHWKEIVIGILFITIGAILTALTGGTFFAAFIVGLKAALISGFISGGINAVGTTISLLIKGEGLEKALQKGLESFGDGFASGFMWGGIFAGGAQSMAAVLKFSRSGTLFLGGKQWQMFSPNNFAGKNIGPFKIWSPNSIGNPNSGGTLLKIGRTFRIDFEAGIQLFHIHITHNLYNGLPAFVRSIRWIFDPARRDVHVRLTSLLGGIIGALEERKSKGETDISRDK